MFSSGRPTDPTEGGALANSITAADLALRVDDPETAPFVLDVRAPDQFEAWQIEGRVKPETINVPYWTAIVDDEETKALIPADRDVIVVCAKGDSSEFVVDTFGMDNLANLAGGMDDWATTLVPHTLHDDGTQVVIQLDRIAKACLSYVVGERGQELAVIDPAADVDAYLRLAEDLDAEITHVFDTHLHADHVSLALELAERTGAVYHISEGDAEEATFDYAALQDGEVFEFGGTKLIVRSVATPGHTPGSTSLEVEGRFLMTGDAVFVTGIGRPDLGGQTDPWARDLFHTIHDRLAKLDHSLEVAPAHYTTRLEAKPDGTLRRELGDLLVNDPVVSIDDEAAFVEYVVTHLGTPPGEYDEIRKINLGMIDPTDDQVRELEVGRNECALSG
jgi:glyoxylase-like metal-dependent hydrolase (beta-lactamase superfamily II)